MRLVVLAASIWILASSHASAGEYSFTRIAGTVDGYLSIGTFPAVNDAGVVAFKARLGGGTTEVIETGSGGSRSRVVTDGDAWSVQPNAPVWTFGGFEPIVDINSSGLVVFRTIVSNGVGSMSSVDVGAGTTTLNISHSNAVVGGESLNTLSSPALADGAAVAFGASTFAPSVAIISAGTLIAETGATYSGFESPDINSSGIIAFGATLSGGNAVVIRSDSGLNTTIFDSGGAVPLGRVSLNENGVVAVYVSAMGVFTADATTMATVADLTSFNSFSGASINNIEEVAFLAFTTGLQMGIFVGPDPLADKVIETGDSLGGSTVVSVTISPHALNGNGQIAFHATLENGESGVFRADPVAPLVPGLTAPLYLVVALAFAALRELRPRNTSFS